MTHPHLKLVENPTPGRKAAYLGIDLGTTNSTAALFDGEQVTIVRNAQGGLLTPSVVRVDSRGKVTVGDKARRCLESDPANTAAEFKRLMGTARQLTFPASGGSKRPEELAAEVLRTLRKDVEDQCGFLPERVVISVPALFEIPQCAATAAAGRLAGFTQVELIQEPIASAIACGWKQDRESGKWLVYDLGGGTLDVSLLETREGFLRVVGHDGDNFLGGKDFDWVIVDWILEILEREHGVGISRSDPANQQGLRRLKAAAEEAKIALSRGRETEVPLEGVPLGSEGGLDAEIHLTREELERRCGPLIERSVDVCRRLLEAHSCRPEDLERIVLVGGPTVMPGLRERLQQALGPRIAEGHDPMTVVAEGAALYALTSGLEAHPVAADPASPGYSLWLQHPTMSSDLTPHVLGRLREPPEGQPPGVRPASVRFLRGDGRWQGPEVPLDEEGAFIASVQLLAHQSNEFRIEGRDERGQPVDLMPASLTIVHGLTVNEPPLSRTIGVALANDTVRVYFERGTPLPAQRQFVHRTVEGLSRGGSGRAIRIPIVQGEYESAHLCRLIGALVIPSEGLRGNLPLGSPVELTLELNRSGVLSARAVLPDLSQEFRDVAHLLVPDADLPSLESSLEACRKRLVSVRGDIFRFGETRAVRLLSNADRELEYVSRQIEAARGGEAEAAQKASRAMLELDALIEEVESVGRWRELEEDAVLESTTASRWVSSYGTPQEQQMLDDTLEKLEAARGSRNLRSLQRNLRVVRNLTTAAFHRHPEAWSWEFQEAAAHANEAKDVRRARELVKEGLQAESRNDVPALKRITHELWELLPFLEEKRRKSYESGLQ